MHTSTYAFNLGRTIIQAYKRASTHACRHASIRRCKHTSTYAARNMSEKTKKHRCPATWMCRHSGLHKQSSIQAYRHTTYNSIDRQVHTYRLTGVQVFYHALTGTQKYKWMYKAKTTRQAKITGIRA